jgi:hypothetical protein
MTFQGVVPQDSLPDIPTHPWNTHFWSLSENRPLLKLRVRILQVAIRSLEPI